jgi:hypothetical protein
MTQPKKSRGRGRPPAKEAERLDHVVQLRLNNVQRSFVLAQAEAWECSMGEAIRRMIDESLDSDTREVEGIYIDGKPATLRQALSIGTPPPEWVAEHMRRYEGD